MDSQHYVISVSLYDYIMEKTSTRCPSKAWMKQQSLYDTTFTTSHRQGRARRPTPLIDSAFLLMVVPADGGSCWWWFLLMVVPADGGSCWWWFLLMVACISRVKDSGDICCPWPVFIKSRHFLWDATLVLDGNTMEYNMLRLAIWQEI